MDLASAWDMGRHKSSFNSTMVLPCPSQEPGVVGRKSLYCVVHFPVPNCVDEPDYLEGRGT